MNAMNIRTSILLPALAISLLASIVAAQNPASDAPAGDPAHTRKPVYMGERPAPARDMSLWRSMAALTVVIGGLVAVNWWLKKRVNGGVGRLRNGRRMRVLERLALDPKRSLLLVSLDGRELLLGVGADQITALANRPARADKAAGAWDWGPEPDAAPEEGLP